MTGLLRPQVTAALVSSALAGAATGARSFTGLAALAVAASPGAATQPDRTLGRPAAKVTAGLLAATEIGLDKLPSAPGRLAPPGLASRLAGAAASGIIIARRVPGDAGAAGGAGVAGNASVGGDAGAGGNTDRSGVGGVPGVPASTDPVEAADKTEAAAAASPVQVTACVAVAAGATVAAAWLGVRWRAWASARLGRDWIGAVLEDAVAVTLAAAATTSRWDR